MKNLLVQLIALLFLAFTAPHSADAQSNHPLTELTYEINRVHPYISTTKENLVKALTIADLNPRFKPSWVKEYFLVEMSTIHQGHIKKAVSKSDVLTPEQKALMQSADVGTAISFKIRYLPNNTLINNDIHEIDFSLPVAPDNEAMYANGQQQLQQYLKENAIDKIPNGIFKRYQLAAVKFTINEEGQIVDPHLSHSSEDQATDELLLQTVCNMPNWKPATYANGKKVTQEFVLTVGDMESCVVPLLNIHPFR